MKNPATILFQVESPEIADKDIISQNPYVANLKLSKISIFFRRVPKMSVLVLQNCISLEIENYHVILVK